MKTIRLFCCLVILITTHFFTAAQDITALEGWQIRPDYAFLKTGQSILLQASFCVSVKGEDSHGGLLYDCDDAPAPLIDQSTVTDWSVNGVLGGNSQLGTVKITGPGLAQYSAPAKKPASETLQVSAVVHLANTTEKITVIATITILDKSRVYFGTVKASGGSDAFSYSASGSLVLKETGPNTENFHAVAGSLQVHLTTKDCGSQSGTVPLSGDMTLWKLEMDKSMLVGPAIYGDTYTLAFMPEPFEVNCDGIKVPLDTVLWFMPCDQSSVKSDPEYNTLWGEGSCGDNQMTWNLVRQ